MEGTPLAADRRGDVFFSDEAELDETAAQPSAMQTLMIQRLLELDRCHALFAQQQFAESDGHDQADTWQPSEAGAQCDAEFTIFVEMALGVVPVEPEPTPDARLSRQINEPLLSGLHRIPDHAWRRQSALA
jgi:hypothetical protein